MFYGHTTLKSGGLLYISVEKIDRSHESAEHMIPRSKCKGHDNFTSFLNIEYCIKVCNYVIPALHCTHNPWMGDGPPVLYLLSQLSQSCCKAVWSSSYCYCWYMYTYWNVFIKHFYALQWLGQLIDIFHDKIISINRSLVYHW